MSKYLSTRKNAAAKAIIRPLLVLASRTANVRNKEVKNKRIKKGIAPKVLGSRYRIM